MVQKGSLGIIEIAALPGGAPEQQAKSKPVAGSAWFVGLDAAWRDFRQPAAQPDGLVSEQLPQDLDSLELFPIPQAQEKVGHGPKAGQHGVEMTFRG